MIAENEVFTQGLRCSNFDLYKDLGKLQNARTVAKLWGTGEKSPKTGGMHQIPSFFEGYNPAYVSRPLLFLNLGKLVFEN